MSELEMAEAGAPDSAGEDYLLQQLKETVLRRQASMGNIRQAHKDDPRAGRSPTSAGLRAHVSQPGMYGIGTPTYGPMFDAMDAQDQFLFENKVNPELLALKNDEADPFTKLLSKVQSNKNAKSTANKNDGWQLVNSNDGGIQRVHVATGKTEHLMSGTIYARQKASAAEAFFNQLAKQNSGASVEEMRISAEVMAERSIIERINSSMGGSGAVAVPLPIGSGQRQPPGSALATEREPSVQPMGNLRRESDLKKALNSDGNIFGAPVHSDPTNDPRFAKVLGVPKQPGTAVAGGVVAPVKTGIEFAATRTPQQLAVQEATGKADVVENTARKESMAAWTLANQSLLPMEAILLSGKHTSGVMHETLNKVGGYLNYIDPKNSLAQAAGNDTAYLNRLMGLVRVDIKALGAGTAVSNLDLIVSQKAAGDLRNVPQGNLKNIGLVKLYNATNSALAQKKIDHFDNTGATKGYVSSTEPTHAIRPTRNAYTGGTNIFSYDVQDKNSWIEEQKARNPGKTIPSEVMNREWKRFADDSVKAMFK